MGSPRSQGGWIVGVDARVDARPGAPPVLWAHGVLALVGLLFGCASYAPIPLAPPAAVDRGHGLLLIVVDSSFAIEALDVGRERLEASGSGVQYLLYDVPAGFYTWKQVEVAQGGHRSARYVLQHAGDRERLGFAVHPGIINYPGHVFVRRAGWRGLRFRTVNRSALAYEGLSGLAPDLLGAYRMEYTGFQRDDFLVEYQEMLERRDATAATGDEGP